MSNRKDRFRKWLEATEYVDDEGFDDIVKSVFDAPLLYAVPDPSIWTDEEVLMYSEPVFDACSGAVWSGDDDDD